MRRLPALIVAIALGIGAGECFTRSFAFRRWLGRVAGQGDLLALVERAGIYDRNLDGAWSTELFANGSNPDEVEPAVEEARKRELLQALIAEEKLNAVASGQAVDKAELQREMNLLRAQFDDDNSWKNALAASDTHLWQLRGQATRNLRIRSWLEKTIAARIQPNESECRAYFATHSAEFAEPLRLRASHLFLAAPDGYPLEVLEAKKALIDKLSQRVINGESFDALVAQFSEDEATKKIGGDLNYFAAERMLPEVFTAAEKLRPGQISGPIRSCLGFHLIRLTSVKPPQILTLEEAQPQIALVLENQKRIALGRQTDAP
ncbi:MAG TPA: peptidylprolyl isomerase [Chthoniobacterales bacterium]|jgi:parvulin-like peptidyl-prolyl isomerase